MRNIIVFGHDPRMESVAGYFYHLGYDVYENPEEPVADARSEEHTSELQSR